MEELVTNVVFLLKSLAPSYFASSRKCTRESTIKVQEKYKKFDRKCNNVSGLFKNCLETLPSRTVFFSECLCPFPLHFVIPGKPLLCNVCCLVCEGVSALQQGFLFHCQNVQAEESSEISAALSQFKRREQIRRQQGRLWEAEIWHG